MCFSLVKSCGYYVQEWQPRTPEETNNDCARADGTDTQRLLQTLFKSTCEDVLLYSDIRGTLQLGVDHSTQPVGVAATIFQLLQLALDSESASQSPVVQGHDTAGSRCLRPTGQCNISVLLYVCRQSSVPATPMKQSAGGAIVILETPLDKCPSSY